MIEVLVVMFAGVFVGYVLRNKEVIIRRIEPLLNWAIYMLLFLIGISVGINKIVVNNLDIIGLQALIITMAGVLGSVVASSFCYKFFFKNKKNNLL